MLVFYLGVRRHGENVSNVVLQQPQCIHRTTFSADPNSIDNVVGFLHIFAPEPPSCPDERLPRNKYHKWERPCTCIATRHQKTHHTKCTLSYSIHTS
mmetsp:Transcript_16792/g.30400  ORF Transcript_16792/g.30400 Transcript_16792/m.30400 type:complete len:97 (+) Transcript_16792:342-632(+)